MAMSSALGTEFLWNVPSATDACGCDLTAPQLLLLLSFFIMPKWQQSNTHIQEIHKHIHVIQN